MFQDKNNAYGRNDLEEDIILQAAVHVKHARTQRSLANEKIKQATFCNDAVNKVDHKDKVQTIIMDYCQNLNLPHLGEDQPGDAYYFSPLSIYCFGICNAVTSHLSAYVYDESEGGKGGNNVASLLLQYVREHFVDSTAGPMSELNVIMDNCAGQNKNRMVIRMAAFMLELKYFSKINLIFLVKGHTKNMCDRMFNSMKHRYHHRNIYTLEETYKILNLDDNVTVNPITLKDFYDWDSFFEKIYKRPKAGSIKKNHIFQLSSETIDTCTLITKVADSSTTAQSQELSKVPKGGTIEERKQLISDPEPPNLVKPGLSFMKQVHLYTKWRPLLPIELQDITCPKPPEDVFHKCKTSLKKKRQLKEALIFDDEDHATSSKRTRSASKKITRKRMKLSTEDNFDDDNDINIPIVTNVEFAAGQGGMFTQPPPPTIAADVESLNDKVGDKVDEIESEDDDNLKNKFIEDSDEDPINEATKLVKENDEFEDKVEINKNDKDVEDTDDDIIEKLLMKDSDPKRNNEETNLIEEHDEVDKEVESNKHDEVVKDVETNKDEMDDMDDKEPKNDVVGSIDQVVITEDSFLGFIDKNFEDDGSSEPESLVDNQLRTRLEEGSPEITNTNKGETSTKDNSSQVVASNPKKDNPSIGVGSIKDSKLVAMKKQIVKTNKKKNNKLKLPKKVTKKQDSSTRRNKPPSSQTSTRTLRSNIPKKKLRSRQVRKNV